MLQSQQNIPHKYNPRDYFGGCMRIQEEQTASFLSDFVNDIVIILPEHYDLMRNLLFILRHSGYRPIKKLLSPARKKFDTMLIAQRERRIAAERVKPTNLTIQNQGANKFAILDNKKKMLMMSCSDLCVLGDAIYNERGFNTTRIKNKFASFVSYRIELVLIGKMPIDSDFSQLLKKYGTPQQIKLYTNIISNRATHRQAPEQKVTKPVTEQKTMQKSGNGFFKKIGQSVKNAFNKAKKPVLVGGIFALSLFGGKRAYDAVTEHTATQPQTESYTIHTPKSPIVQPVNSVPQTNKSVTPQSNEIIKKTVKQLQYLKENNPTDKNMDVFQTANQLHQKFGKDAYKVVLVSAMTPYALNDYTKFNIRPTTHNMIEYLCTSELTPTQTAALNEFIAMHVNNNAINMNIFMQNQR